MLQGRPDGNGRFIFSNPGGDTTPQYFTLCF
jgi:hypothetical protein